MFEDEADLSRQQEAIVRARVRERMHQAATLSREVLQRASGGMEYLPWRQVQQYATALAGLDRLIAELDDLS